MCRAVLGFFTFTVFIGRHHNPILDGICRDPPNRAAGLNRRNAVLGSTCDASPMLAIGTRSVSADRHRLAAQYNGGGIGHQAIDQLFMHQGRLALSLRN
ncbi:MAG: hypothetical protein ACI97A_003299 [Planctomycetota bacterium]|jgi:hypothetical protein